MAYASKLTEKLGDNGLVVVYPYFIAEKSGTLKVELNRIIIETVKGDLWNFVSDGYKNATIIIQNDGEEDILGDEEFLSEVEKDEIVKWVPKIRGMFRDDIYSGESVLLEWSFASDSDSKGEKISDSYLVFYEARTVE